MIDRRTYGNKTEIAKGVTGQEIAGPGSGVSSISGSVAGEAVVVKRSDITNETNDKEVSGDVDEHDTCG